MSLKPEQLTEALNLLKQIPLFAGCSDEMLQAIASRLTYKTLGASKIAMMDQEINRTLYLLAKGSVGVWKRIQNDKKKLATLSAPNFFGERSVFEEAPASASIKTEDDAVLYLLERPLFLETSQAFPALKDILKKNLEQVRAQRITPTREPDDKEPS